jgi:superfamily II DNA or RNA helicase
MIEEEKRSLTYIGKDERFKFIFEKLTIGLILDYNEKSYILATAIIFLKHFEKDNRFKTYADISYYIILKYSVFYHDYIPLYDFSVNFGFFPIVKSLTSNELYKEDQLIDYIIDIRLDEFKNPNQYYETLEQNIQSQNFIEDNSAEKAYIAPTSFGKSSIIVDYLRDFSPTTNKVAIIVPTKSLLMQTYQMIRTANLQKRIIIHDEMYNDETNFIAIFTQERALRLINRKKIFFDVLIIDEAHNILKKDNSNRQVLLSRLIKRNLLNKPNHKVIYLSPLINDVSNLKVSNSQTIHEHKVNFNVKEPDIFELTVNNEKFQYNRFVNQFYLLESSIPNKYNYILRNSLSKNFIYENSPRRIEKIAEEFSNHLSSIENDIELKKLTDVLINEVHKDFYGIKYLKYGIIYLHGKLPDIIKEYLESKFKSIKSIKHLIANTVILEGINLPIESLFILNTYRLQGKELINLIGRINRLNDIFSNSNLNLEKLIPKVHFINNKEFANGHNSKIEILRSRIFEDKIENPILEKFDIEKLDDVQRIKAETIINNESTLFIEALDEKDIIRKYIIENGIDSFYSNTEKTLLLFIKMKNKINSKSLNEWSNLRTIDKVNIIFIENQEIDDYEFRRLNNLKARNYYHNYITNLRKLSFNERVNSHVKYFYEIKESTEPLKRKLYVGSTYGEVPYQESSNTPMNNYVDLTRKSNEVIVNLAIVKLKMEDDFISFKLNKFIVMLFDFELISLDEYNLFIYGTVDIKNIALTKSGLTSSLIVKLENDNQIKNIEFDRYNNLTSNNNFKTYLETINDLNRYEMNKYIM